MISFTTNSVEKRNSNFYLEKSKACGLNGVNEHTTRHMADFANGFAVGGVKFAVWHVHSGGEASARLLGWTSYIVIGLDDITRII
jgi:hypothetical protein